MAWGNDRTSGAGGRHERESENAGSGRRGLDPSQSGGWHGPARVRGRRLRDGAVRPGKDRSGETVRSSPQRRDPGYPAAGYRRAPPPAYDQGRVSGPARGGDVRLRRRADRGAGEGGARQRLPGQAVRDRGAGSRDPEDRPAGGGGARAQAGGPGRGVAEPERVRLPAGQAGRRSVQVLHRAVLRRRRLLLRRRDGATGISSFWSRRRIGAGSGNGSRGTSSLSGRSSSTKSTIRNARCWGRASSRSSTTTS